MAIVTTRGFVVDLGADYVKKPFYDDKLKVRIPDLHGYDDLAPELARSGDTVTKNIPWCSIIPQNLEPTDEYQLLQYKADNFSIGDLVYVQYDTDIMTDMIVTGTYMRYNSSIDYNGMELEELVENTPNLDQYMTKNASSSGDSEDSDSSSGETVEGSGVSTIANNIEQWKTVFGNPFKKKVYTITSKMYRNKNGQFNGAYHGGYDLACAKGTEVYACGDGTVVRSRDDGSTSFGQHIIIDHGAFGDTHLYTLYGHLCKRYVSVGDKVMGTQNGQAGTLIGLVDSTGYSTGHHLHLQMMDKKGYSNDSVSMKNALDPGNYITF